MRNTKYIIITIALVMASLGSIFFWLQTQNHTMGVQVKTEISETQALVASSEDLIENQEDKQVIDEAIEKLDNRGAEVKTTPDDQVQQATVGAVDLAVQFYNPDEDIDDYWIFQVAMDTHSVDLDLIDLKSSIYFIGDNGLPIESGFKVKKSGSGHHVSQYIELPKRINGQETILKDFKRFKMILKGIDGVEITELIWDMTKYPALFN